MRTHKTSMLRNFNGLTNADLYLTIVKGDNPSLYKYRKDKSILCIVNSEKMFYPDTFLK